MAKAKSKWEAWRDHKADQKRRQLEERQAWAEEQRRQGRQAMLKAERERQAWQRAELERQQKAREAARREAQLRLDRAFAAASAEEAVDAHWTTDWKGEPDGHAKAVRIVKKLRKSGERAVAVSSHDTGKNVIKRHPVILFSSGYAGLILSGEYCRVPFTVRPYEESHGVTRTSMVRVEGVISAGGVVDGSIGEAFDLLREQQEAAPSGHHKSSSTFVAPGLIRTALEAEEAVADWLRWRGHTGVVVTATGADEGIDVVSTTTIAQVKFVGLPTGRPAVQQLFGVAQAEKKSPCFFSLAGYTAQAQDWANRVGLATFTFDRTGVPEPTNTPASELAQPPVP